MLNITGASLHLPQVDLCTGISLLTALSLPARDWKVCVLQLKGSNNRMLVMFIQRY